MSWRRFVCELRRCLAAPRLTAHGVVASGLTLVYPPSSSYTLFSNSRRCMSLNGVDLCRPNSPLQRAKDAFMSELGEGLSPDDLTKTVEACAPILDNFSRNLTGNREKIIELLEVLARTGDVTLVKRALRAAENFFEFRTNRLVHQTIVRRLAETGHLLQAITWLIGTPTKSGQIVPFAADSNEVLASCIDQGQFALFKTFMDHLLDRPESRIRLNAKTYKLFFEALFHFDPSKPPSMLTVQILLDYMKERGIGLSLRMVDILLEGFRRFNAEESIQAVNDMYDYATDLTKTLSIDGTSAAESQLESFRARGFVPTAATLDAMVPHIMTVEDFRGWIKLLNVVASPSAWVSLIRNVSTHSRSWRKAVKAYNGHCGYGYVPTPVAFHLVIHAICTKEKDVPIPIAEKIVKTLLDLLHEYVLSLERNAPRLPSQYSPQDDLPIYVTILHFVTSSSHFWSHALDLLEEMTRRGIVMDSASARVLVPRLLQVAPNTQAAFRIYQRCLQSPDGKYVLDELGFHAVLDVFCKSCITAPEHVKEYLLILEDLRRARYLVNAQIYTQVLSRLSTLAVYPKRDHELSRKVAAMIKRVHNAIILDPSLRPDTIMWNELMNAYQRAGSFNEAYSVWESMYMSGMLDNASVSIFMDVCSFSGAGTLATETFAKLHAAGFPLNLRNWSNWIEALCRLGRIMEATKVLCVVMPKQKDVQPTVQIAELILKFVDGQSQRDEVRSRIRRYLPDLYVDLRTKIYP